MEKMIIRCQWTSTNPLMITYHDEEWGVPLHDDNKIFEFLTLEAMQAGLSWNTIINKRENFRKAFDNFNPQKVAKYGEKEFQRLMSDAGIIRNRQKLNATINNAQRFLEVQKEFGSFDKYIWQFTHHTVLNKKWKKMSQLPAMSKESDKMSEDLKKRGFKFVGSTICYAHMQATGMVNDHTIDCFRYVEVSKL